METAIISRLSLSPNQYHVINPKSGTFPPFFSLICSSSYWSFNFAFFLTYELIFQFFFDGIVCLTLFGQLLFCVWFSVCHNRFLFLLRVDFVVDDSYIWGFILLWNLMFISIQLVSTSSICRLFWVLWALPLFSLFQVVVNKYLALLIARICVFYLFPWHYNIFCIALILVF